MLPKGKDVLVFRRERRNKLFLVALTLDHTLGALADITSRLEKAKFSLQTGYFTPTKEEDYGRFSCYMTATVGRPRAAEVKALLEESPFCKEVEVKDAHNGMLVDSLNFPLRWNTGDRAIMIRAHFFAVMEEAVRSLLSSGADVILYQMGFNHGKPSWTQILSDYTVNTKEDLEEVIAIYSAVGWGKTEVLSFDKQEGQARIAVTDNFECIQRPEGAPEGCHFIRGHFGGLFATVFKSEKVKITELACSSTGAPACEFSVTVPGDRRVEIQQRRVPASGSVGLG